MIYIIDDDEIMAECIKKACKKPSKVFSNAIEAMLDIAGGEIPEMIFLDILLDGPDGFTFLDELMSYPDTKKIPIVIVSSLDFKDKNLTEYGVVGVLDKDKMTPEEISGYVGKHASQ